MDKKAADTARQSLSTGLLISDFNADNLAALLTHDGEQPAVQVKPAPYGQVYQYLVDGSLPEWASRPDFAIVWTRPQGVIPSYAAAQAYERPAVAQILAEVDEYADLLLGLKDRVKVVLAPTWTLPASERGYGLLDLRPGLGLSGLLMRMNLRLAERLEPAGNIYLLDASRWTAAAGRKASVPKLWYMGKIAFSNEVFREAAAEIRAALRALSGMARKLLVLDLDDTLWGGIVGDDGWENLTLGGHNLVGEAYVDFQKALKALTRRGVVLGIASKNDEQVALEAIRSHPEMVLQPEDFAGWRINWNDKAQNIAALAETLNLGLQSVVFIDDNPVERARVREALPEVLVPEWPEDKTLYKQALQELTCFDIPAISAEDAKRTEMYVVERQRTALKEQAGSLDEWLKGLDIRVTAEKLNGTNLPRAAQLFNKTNQMNLATRRMTAEELSAWAEQPGHSLWTFRVADRFGDSGLTGILGLQLTGERLEITDYLLSCRVMGRKVEETMLALAVRAAQQAGAREVVAVYRPTAKNRPCLEFWQRSGFTCQEPDTFRWDTTQEYPVPEQVKLLDREAEAQ